MTELNRIGPPTWLKELNDELMKQQEDGSLPFELAVLTVPGRRTGLPRRTPLTVLDHGGDRYVLGGFPAAEWIRNVRAAGRGTLRVGDRDEQVRLVELDPADVGPIMRRWPEVTPSGVEMMRDAGVIDDVTPEAMAAVAGICPVFRVEAA